jgi:phosphonate transport system substrate-binding protein
MKRNSANRESAALSWILRTLVFGLAVFGLLSLPLGFVNKAAAAKIDTKLPPLKIAFIPFENPEQLVDNVGPAIAFLERQLGRKIRYFTTLNYSSAVEALNAGKADISFMSPLPYVLVNAQTGAGAILGEIYNGKSYYYSKIFVRKDSGIKTLADLKSKTIAYVDPISSSGFMYPHDILIRAGLAKGGFDNPEGDFFRRVYYAGGDEQAMRALYGKFVDAAGVGEFAINPLRQEERDEIVVIAESKRIPSHCVVARKDLRPKLKEQFIQAMLKLNEPENRKYVQHLYGTDGYVRVNKGTYQSVADMARKYGIMK